jgi:hypothetical protein
MMVPCRNVSGVSDVSALEALTDLADRVRHLYPSHRDPERFHLNKLEIERELRRLARKVANG